MVRLKGTDLLPVASARKLLWGTLGSCLVWVLLWHSGFQAKLLFGKSGDFLGINHGT